MFNRSGYILNPDYHRTDYLSHWSHIPLDPALTIPVATKEKEISLVNQSPVRLSPFIRDCTLRGLHLGKTVLPSRDEQRRYGEPFVSTTGHSQVNVVPKGSDSISNYPERYNKDFAMRTLSF